MNQETVKIIERQIAEAVIRILLSEGYTLSISNGESSVISKSGHSGDILKAMFSKNEDVMIVYGDEVIKDTGPGIVGTVHFSYGSEGWDCLKGFSDSLEILLEPVDILAGQLQLQHT